MICEHIRFLREDRNFSQAQIASLLNMAQNTYSQYETGKIAWTDMHLVKLADYYQVSVDYLLGRTKNPNLNH